MLRKHLLLTTALLAAAALAPSTAAAGEPALSAFPDIAAGSDANQQFMCQYGGFKVSATHAIGHYFDYHAWTHVAFPIVGGGKTVRRIKVKDERPPPGSGLFSAGIYSNGPSGFPGTLLASGAGTASSTYGTVIIDIPPTMLRRHKRYWVVEETRGEGEVCWKPNRQTRRKAYVQDFHSYSTTFSSGKGNSSYLSPWMKQWTGAYVRLK